MPIIIREYSVSDWKAVCDVHDSARPIEIGSFATKGTSDPVTEVAKEDGFFDGQQYVWQLSTQNIKDTSSRLKLFVKLRLRLTKRDKP